MSLVLPPPPERYDPRSQAQAFDEIRRAILRLDTKIEDVRVAPRVRDIIISFNDRGQALLNVRCNADTLSLRYAISADAAPDRDTVAAAAIQDGPDFDVTLEGPFSIGAVLYVSVLPYAGPDGDGREGDLASNSATRGDPYYDECRAVVLSTTATQVVVEVTGISRTGTATVKLVDADGATVESGLAVDVGGASPQRWTFTRPTSGDTPTPRFTASFPDSNDDSDLVSIPLQGVTPLYFLGVRARVLTVQEDTLIVRVTAADPFPQGVDTVRLSGVLDGVASTAPALPVDLTPTAAFSAADDAFVDLTIPRPGYGEADGEIVFRLTSLLGSRIDDYDVLPVPAQTRAVPWLRISRTLTPTQATITWDGGPTVTYSTDGGATFVTPPASPFTVDRPPSALGFDLTYIFRAEGFDNGQVIYSTQEVTIARQGPDYIAGLMVTTIDAPGDGGGSFSVSFTEGVPGPTDIVYEVTYSITAGGTGTSFVTDQVTTGSVSPITVDTPLGDDGGSSPIGGVVTVRAYYEDTLLDEAEYDGLFAI